MVAVLSDADYLARAFLHAERGRGRTTPNPVVGAVVVSPDGVVVGHGYHERAGEPHAEIHALNAAGLRARGATLYCTLEPCAHVGRTGPCVARIVAAGVARVVAATGDPNPLVSGRGFDYLRDHGVRVEVGLGEAQARAQNAAFFSVVQRRRPLVIAKVALSIDACLAGPGGAPVSLTSAPANRRVQLLRASVDAIGVGSGTILADDPRLTARGVFRERPLTRVIFDRRLRTPPRARIFGTLASGPIVILSNDVANARARALQRAGATIVEAPDATLRAMVERLTAHDVASVLLEGGAAVHRAAVEENLIDCLHMVVTPGRLGADGSRWLDATALPWGRMVLPRARVVGPDVWLEADVHGAR